MSMTRCCGNCDRFALEPGKRKAGACLMHCPALREPVYVRVCSVDVCNHWIPIGQITRYEPYVIGGGDERMDSKMVR